MIYKFRIVLDIKDDDIFRDIEIEETATFEDLHNAIVNACELDGEQMASFYLSDNKWSQNEEITLFEMGESDEGNKIKTMSNWALHEFLNKKQNRLLYVYDFFSMWTFFLEIIEVVEKKLNIIYPRMTASVGLMPEESPSAYIFDENDFSAVDDEFDIFDGDDSFNQSDDFYDDSEWN